MIKYSPYLLLPLTLLVSIYGSPTIDGSSEALFESSLLEVRQTLNEQESDGFNQSLEIILGKIVRDMDESVAWGMMLGMGEEDFQPLILANMLATLDGKDVAGIHELAVIISAESAEEPVTVPEADVSEVEKAAPPVSFDGDWRGFIKLADGGEIRLKILIEGDSYTSFYKNADDEWESVVAAVSYYEQLADVVMLGWINHGGVWTENQMYSLSYVNSSKLDVVWTRHVTNRVSSDDGESWNVRAEGELIRID